MSAVTNWPAKFEELVDFVGITEEDRQLIKDSAPIIRAHSQQFTDAIYDHFLQYPQARQFFVTKQNEPDPKLLESNKKTMISWLHATAAAPLNEGFVRFLAATSQMHANIPIHRAGLPPVPPRYIIGTIALYQTAIADVLRQEMDDADAATRTSMAWNKWLMVGLEFLLANYLTHEEV